jgi:hypothetical protein
MVRSDRPAPEWRAPRDLLPRIMAAVEAERLRPAPTACGWPRAARMAMAACACAVLVAGQWLLTVAIERGLLAPWSHTVDEAAQWLAASSALARALGASVDAVLGAPTVQLVLMATGAAMALVSLATAIGYSHILNPETTRYHHERT